MGKTTKNGSPKAQESKNESEAQVMEEKTLAKVEAPSTAMTIPGATPEFVSRYKKQIEGARRPSEEEFQSIIDAMPEDLMEQVVNLIRKLSSKREGMYLTDNNVEMIDVRINHGQGNDANKPEDLPAGHFYLSSKEAYGKEFVATVVAVWQGRSMWPNREDTAAVKRPLCTSFDRIMGNTHGECAKCPFRPWANNERTDCSDDIVALLFPKDLSNVLQLRFQKTSVKSGQGLVSFLKQTMAPWMKWYKFSLEKQVGKTDASIKWYTIKVDKIPGAEGNTAPELQAFARAMFKVVEHDLILPRLANTYRSAAANAVEPTDPVGGTDTGKTTDNPDYDDMDGPKA